MQYFQITLLALVLVVPWIIWRWAEPFFYRRRVNRFRASLSEAGLTPKQYIASIDPTDQFRVAQAKTNLGID